MDLIANQSSLLALGKLNVILGKNGCGKSFLLKNMQAQVQPQENLGQVRYISPERGGILQYEPNIEVNIGNNPLWLQDTRRNNQAQQFRQQSATLFRRLELLVLREIERESFDEGYVPHSFTDTIEKINQLLDRVRLERDVVKAFKIVDRDTGQETTPQDISSGESELISLGIEILSFVREAEVGKQNFLLMDEPDVHLHPDLQDRLARFIIDTLADKPVSVVVATHSTPLLAGLSIDPETRLAFKRRDQNTLTFRLVSEVDRTILPIFGAHPLSNIFNQAPVLIVEGEDDERLWQQAIRSSRGRIRLFPCVATSVDLFGAFETEVNALMDAVYDNAIGFSLRDRDLGAEQLDDFGHIIRMRLSCRAAENLMLSDEALALAGTDWTSLQSALGQWAQANTTHRYQEQVLAFIDDGFDRKGHDLKNIRNILIGLVSSKPWEVLVGQAIAALATDDGPSSSGSLRNYLGEKACEHILKLPPAAAQELPAEASGAFHPV